MHYAPSAYLLQAFGFEQLVLAFDENEIPGLPSHWLRVVEEVHYAVVVHPEEDNKVVFEARRHDAARADRCFAGWLGSDGEVIRMFDQLRWPVFNDAQQYGKQFEIVPADIHPLKYKEFMRYDCSNGLPPHIEVRFITSLAMLLQKRKLVAFHFKSINGGTEATCELQLIRPHKHIKRRRGGD